MNFIQEKITTLLQATKESVTFRHDPEKNIKISQSSRFLGLHIDF